MFLGSFWYPRTPWICSTKPFTKWLGCCGGKSQYVRFFPICSPPSQYLNIIRFVCSWARLDTQELPEDAPQNRSQNGWVVVEVSAWMLAFLHLCLPSSHYLNIVRFTCSYAPLDTQELPEYAPQNCSQNGWVVVEVCPSMFAFYPYAHPLLSTLILSVLCVSGLVQTPKNGVKMLQKTIHKTVGLLWR